MFGLPLVNVICAGITGCRKESAIRNVISFLENADPASRGSAGQQNVEGILETKVGVKWGTFLRTLNFASQERYAREILDEAISRLKPYRHRFLNLHLTLYHNNRFFAPFPLERITDFEPDLIVTFIEDVYAAWARVKKKSDTLQDPVKTYFRLRELMAWRSVEIMMADYLAMALRIPNFVVAVKHPPGMLHSLLFHPSKLMVYSAYPISRFRREGSDHGKLAEDKKKLQSFLGKLQEKFILFNPTTIDERILRNLTTPLQAGARWELPMEQMVSEGDIQYPIPLSQPELNEIASDIDPNIKFRDFRLVRDVDCVVAYRPYWDGKVHEGVKSEIDQAQNLIIDSVFYFPGEDGKVDDSPFAGQASAYYRDEAEVIADLEKRVPRNQRQWGIR